MSSAGGLAYNNCVLNNSGISTTPSSNSAGVVYMHYCTSTGVHTTSSSGVMAFNLSVFNIGAISNTTPITTAGTGSSNMTFCQVVSGSASAISIGSNTTMDLINMAIYSTATNAITGSGTCVYSSVIFDKNSNYLNNTTTLSGT